MPEAVVHIAQLNVQYGYKTVLDGLDWEINKGESWLLGGKSGSGKSSLARAISQATNADGKISISFDHSSTLNPKVHYVPNWYQFTNLEGDRNFYYQQRYNKQQKNDTLTVYAELLHFGEKENLDFSDIADYLTLFGFDDCKNTQLIELSSGEHKKLQLLQAIWLKPQLLIIDEPYTGLDKQTRKNLNQVFDALIEEGMTLLLISNDTDLPKQITHFAEIQNGKLAEVDSAEDFSMDELRQQKTLPYFLQQEPAFYSDTILQLKNIGVRYGEKEVLKNVSWTVKAGEKWLLQGSNGSGKSTLLSLLNGDHPQAYANDIYLFGNKRGSGESIWDIKEKVGIISPELHWYFDKSAKVWQSIASGFYDSIGLFRDLGFDKQQKVNQLLDFFDLLPYKNDLLTSLPLGKQRLVLLARTIIKNPTLLILDEPCQGLDQAQTTHFNEVVDELCRHGKTLIYVGHYESQIPNSIEKKILLEKGEVKAIETLLEAV
ncbi:ATP-binding cassette domain-containing protein [Sphingobacterium hungaricum]|uniref:Molybdenum ABC transporter ATP-binding protein n=1 Tax=Sphingobacterium hungaricum TaxID=2082723 RepID=A0A928UYJ2_9SPHI|nr:ATP-binding cassette domain-containing protein [Sphingobacterium hungaricum]MBE8713751.1 molybdenum ABC transporter ATP-binding protein [Sphingobacterium hungaricum]